MKKAALMFVVLAAMPAQQQPKETAAAPKDPPKITAEMREAFFQAKADVLEAQAKLTDAQKRMQDSVKSMESVCPLMLDAQGKPQCAPPLPPTEAKGSDKK